MKLPQPDKSSLKPTLVISLVVASLVLTTMWFREGDRGPVHRLQNAMQAMAAPAEVTGEFVTRPIRGVVRWAEDLGVSRSELETLRAQNTKLRERVAGLEEARLENARLRALAGFVQQGQVKPLLARVIGRPENSWEGVVTIDKGTADGVRASMPVVAAGGLLGQTTRVTGHTAKVRLISDQGSGVASIIQSSRAEGVVRGSIQGALNLDFVNRDATVKPGDVVITSGLGGVYPKGLLVGEVTKVANTPAGLYQSISVAPSADLKGLEEVLVLTGATPAQLQVGSGE